MKVTILVKINMSFASHRNRDTASPSNISELQRVPQSRGCTDWEEVPNSFKETCKKEPFLSSLQLHASVSTPAYPGWTSSCRAWLVQPS